MRYLQDFLSACLVRFLSLGAVLDVGPLVAVFTRLSKISSSPSVKLPLGWMRNDLLESLLRLLHGSVPCMLSTSDMSLPSSWRSSASARSSFVLNFPIWKIQQILQCFVSQVFYVWHSVNVIVWGVSVWHDVTKVSEAWEIRYLQLGY